MVTDNQHFFTRCPHCLTMFRAGLPTSEDWVKCGRCKKVFDCRKNQINPKDFLKADKAVEQENTEKVEPQQQQAQVLPTVQTSASLKLDEKSQQKEKLTESSKAAPADKAAVDNEYSAKPLQPEPIKTSEVSQDPRRPQEHQLSFIENRQPESAPQTIHPKASESIKLEKEYGQISGHEDSTVNESRQSTNQDKPNQPKLSIRPASEPEPLQTGHKQKSARKIKPEKKSTQGSQITKNILAHAQSLKKDKTRPNSKTGYTLWLAVFGLFALLIWQIAIVNYTRLSNYNFLSTPLNLTCAIFSCNQQQPLSQNDFEILHASLRRHSSTPGAITISANLINYSNNDKLLPKIRLDLIDDHDSIVASKTIDLVENPQFVDPAINRLAPGQDVKLVFDIDRPLRAAVGFQLNIMN